ncbi:MAG: cation diffusion facilitator family transporter [Pseudomonadota bacterium]
MSAAPPMHGSPEAEREKNRVALTSVLAAILLTATKLVVGFSTGSLGILSEAAHSGLDLVAAVVTLFAVRAASRPADRDHPYGHGKIENLSALFETLLLLVTCVWIVYEGVHRLFVAPVAVEATWWAFAVVGLSIVVDYGRSRALMRVARKYNSQALEADALHFSTDIWSSSVVLVGLIAVRVSAATGLTWLAQADAVAALGVAAIVVGISFRLGKKSVDDLIDAVPPELTQVVTEAVQVEGVREVRQVRLRRAGPEVFADVTLSMDRGLNLERAHAIADQAETAVRTVLPGADVVVHVDPVAAANENLLDTVRALAGRWDLGVHGVHVLEEDAARTLELHLEAHDDWSLAEAHRRASAFEAAAREALPGVDHVLSHVEPVGACSVVQHASVAESERVELALADIAATLDTTCRPHKVTVRRTGEVFSVALHCEVAPDVSLADAHALTHQIERRLRQAVEHVGRVIIHVEPSGEHAHD